MAGDEELGQLRQVFGQKTKPLWDTMAALSFILDAKDINTRDHSEKASRLAAQIARQM